MKRALAALLALLFACLEFWASDKPGQAPGISAAPSEDLVRVYGELRSLQVGEQTPLMQNFFVGHCDRLTAGLPNQC